MDNPTIAANDRYVQYTYSGGAPVFDFDFPVYDASSVALYVNLVMMKFTEDYTVTVYSDMDGGAVTVLKELTDGDIVTIVGNTPLERTEYYASQAVVSPSAIDAENSKNLMRMQQLNTKIFGCLQNNVTEREAGNTLLPLTDDRKGHVAAWDGDTGALSYFGDGAMDEIYLKRDNNLSDLTDVDAARDNLHIIDGRELVNNGKDIEYRSILEFNKAFTLLNDIERTLVSLALVVTNMGSGLPVVTQFTGNTIWARTIRATGSIMLDIASDGSILLHDNVMRGVVYEFSADDWSDDVTIFIPHTKHTISDDASVMVSVRDIDGFYVNCNVKVEENGDITLYATRPFSGSALVYGGITPFSQAGMMTNPMLSKGDIIYGCDDSGTPDRLPIGEPAQALCVSDDGLPKYRTLGDAAWLYTNVANGALQLDDDGMVPAELLPFSTMTYKGTFGTDGSTTGGDLPNDGVLDGDIYVCVADEYYSDVAGMTFSSGQWAIYNGESWDIVPSTGGSDATPIGTVISYTGTVVPSGYISCNGYTLAKASYSALYAVIGDTYNTGDEGDGYFSVPNYNNEKLFLQGALVPGTKHAAGLPDIYGKWGSIVDGKDYINVEGAVSVASYASKAYSGNTDGYHRYYQFLASDYDATYGNSDTVQPPAQDVMFLIKYRNSAASSGE